MDLAFPDPLVPIATCEATDCTGCSIADSVHCHFCPADLVRFLLISIPAFLVGGAAVLSVGLAPLFIWVSIIVGFFGFAEIRVMCSHCPHYAEDGTTLGCWANHGSPKLWKYRPGPMSTTEYVVFFGGFVIVWGYPLAFFLVGGLWFLLGLYLLLTIGSFVVLKIVFCSKCINFACPLNGVPDEARILFFERNPSVGRAWNRRCGRGACDKPHVLK